MIAPPVTPSCPQDTPNDISRCPVALLAHLWQLIGFSDIRAYIWRWKGGRHMMYYVHILVNIVSFLKLLRCSNLGSRWAITNCKSQNALQACNPITTFFISIIPKSDSPFCVRQYISLCVQFCGLRLGVVIIFPRNFSTSYRPLSPICGIAIVVMTIVTRCNASYTVALSYRRINH